ncbi:hypothetical protein [Mycolicibacterium chlorophenolicum]|uniref:DUF4760 domain-containing protein n=1 Tax=Mycolicibacterium chlorophenolicum TaxID=37916 RepID=A0A0J6VBL9_9MYCO|nr:hypothetical protein [Mycolicibacterium chlorophenolicum]KMO67112.1 hypothetical protein MCHLDSM_06361 [Mycolicibacterium chlorophenolicum]
MPSRWKDSDLLSAAVFIWGVAILLSVLLGSAVMLSMTSPDSDLVDVVVALATVGSALANIALTVAALLALRSIGESRRDRNAAAMTDLSQRWDNEHFRGVRDKIQEFSGLGADAGIRLKDRMIELRSNGGADYRRLLTEPGFLEDLAISINYGGIYFDIVKDSLGYIVWDRWCLWQQTVVDLRTQKNEPTIFEHFEGLAYRMKAEMPNLPDLDKWDGPKS